MDLWCFSFQVIKKYYEIIAGSGAIFRFLTLTTTFLRTLRSRSVSLTERVVPAMSVTIWISDPASALNSELLPTFGLPMIKIDGGFGSLFSTILISSNRLV